ncbi:rod shape-determining protein MreC [Anaeromyxobacter sp. Fw109-5]|uniref:rod shape-determining protein MreC n=1 Tax=Anaeromyxobacter sp. (strain Fw109-5) TaxID=404589 RepID=UPI0003258546|nr:rod shape-determining protein MreC [Anaeromyxobacter sp. Fw109-5]
MSVFALLRRYRELILVAVLLVVPLGVYFAHARKPSERSRLDRAILWLTTPVERAVGWTVSGAVGAWDGYLALRHAREKATALSQKVNELEIERQQLLAERAEVERLRKLLGFAQASPDRKYVGGRIVGVRLAPAGLQVVTIDRGAEDGVEKLMPVVVADGVVGRVHAVSAHTADVLVVTDRNSSIAAVVERTRARANVRGLGKPDACKLDYALRVEDMIEGDVLVTSGTDGVFPRGLPIGKVTKLERNQHGLFQEARVVPSVDVTRLEEVLVVTDWERTADILPAAYVPGHAP